MSTGATDVARLRARQVQSCGIGAAVTDTDRVNLLKISSSKAQSFADFHADDPSAECCAFRLIGEVG